MRKSTQAIALTGASAVLFSTMALPASAAETADTPATMEVAASSLSITAPTASVVLGKAIPGEATDSTALGDVTVTDLRAGILGWVASATVTVFTSEDASSTIPATAVAYTAPDATVTGTVAVAATSPSSIAESTVVQTATAVIGNNTATWSPSIVVTVPDQALAAADYAATFTHSVV